MPLDTLANIKLQLTIASIDDDELLTKLQAAADGYVSELCGRDFTGGSFTEDHPGGGRLVFLANFPISAIASVNVDAHRAFGADTIRSESDYIVHADRGVIESLTGPFLASPNGRADDFPRTVRVAYSTPTGQVPEPVRRAYADLVSHWNRQAKTHAATGQLNVLQQTDGSTVTQYPWGQSGGFRVPAGVLELLRPYRVPNV